MRFFLCIALLALSADALAQHNAEYRPSGSVTTTDVSGTADLYRIGTLRNFGADFVHGLTLFEGSGGVCSVEAAGWVARDGFYATTSWRRTDRFELLTESLGSATRTVVDCRGNRPAGDGAEADFPRAPRSDSRGSTGPLPLRVRGQNGTAAIGGVRVCTDGRDNGTVRGVTLLYRTINEGGNGRVQRSGEDTIERRGCTDWQRVRHCPKNQVATGVDLHYARAEGQKADRLTGIALRCQGVEITPIDG
ncbi:MAG: hypothetical protein AAGI52_12575 [Bacteroidota bacterium]